MTVQEEVPKSRITLTYKTNIEGEPAVVDLPFRLLVLGDLSGGTSKDRKLDLDERKLRALDGSNLNEVMRDMGAKIELVVPNKIDPNEESMRVKVNIDSMRSFTPEEIAKQVPQLRSLVLVKKLLEEIQSNIANKKEFAQLINKLFSNPGSIESLKEKLKDFASHKVSLNKKQNQLEHNQPQGE